MTFIIATIVIYLSYSFFKILWRGISFRAKILTSKHTRDALADFGLEPNVKKTKIHLSILILVVAGLLYLFYFLFSQHNFGYSISVFIGVAISFVEVVSNYLSGSVSKSS